MGTTKWGVPFPEPSDPVTDGATAMEALARGFDRSLQTGTTVVTPAAEDSWTEKIVTFPVAYNGTPRVMVCIEETGTADASCRVADRESQSVTVSAKRPIGSGTSPVTVTWFAIGTAAAEAS